MEMGTFLIIWILSMPIFSGLMVIFEHWKKKRTPKPAPVTHQATPYLITENGQYVESLEGNGLQKRNRSA